MMRDFPYAEPAVRAQVLSDVADFLFLGSNPAVLLNVTKKKKNLALVSDIKYNQ